MVKYMRPVLNRWKNMSSKNEEKEKKDSELIHIGTIESEEDFEKFKDDLRENGWDIKDDK